MLSQIADTVERISEALVLVEPNQFQSLAQIHTQFEEVGRWAVEHSTPDIGRKASESISLLESVILQDTQNPQATLDSVGDLVSGIQDLLRDFERGTDGPLPAVDLSYTTKEADAALEGEAQPSHKIYHPTALPPHVDERIFEDFLARQGSVLERMEELILGMEKSSNDADFLELRRVLHTIKGEAGLLGLNDVARLCHSVEDLLSEGGGYSYVDRLLLVKDWLGRAFDSYSCHGDLPEAVDSIIAQLTERIALAEASEETEKQGISPQAAEKKRIETEIPEPVSFEADRELLSDFILEAREHLDAVDVHLLTLETIPEDEESINAVFRAFHTIKGVAGFLMLNEIQSLSHEAESLLDRVRKNQLRLVGSAIDVTFDAVDALKRLVTNVSSALTTGQPLIPETSLPQLISRLQAVVLGKSIPPPRKGNSSFGPEAKLGDILIETGKVTRDIVETALKTQESHPGERRLGDILVESISTTTKRVQEALDIQKENPERGKLGEILVEIGAVSKDDIDLALRKQGQGPVKPRLGEVLVRTGQVAARDVAMALRDQKTSSTRQPLVQVKEAIKVDAERLDRLIDMIGEMVIAESMVSQSSELRLRASAELLRQLNLLDKITRELQEIGMALRMVPIRSTFQKMARLVRDLAKKSDKQVDFDMVGEDTELDKTVVDKIGDPLVHMIRNALDHGIEATVADRIKAGKPPVAHVCLKAFHKAGSINIEVQDDGRGLDRDAILAKAREKDLVREGETLSEREIFGLIFKPGFSTAKIITDVSGRGVGMDVVKRNVDALRGQVEIQSTPGKGSTFSIRLPLTLAIIDGMLVRVGNERYVIPTLSIVTSLRPRKEEVTSVICQGETIEIQGRLIPLFHLDRIFGVRGAVQDVSEALVVVIEDENQRAGLVVDELLGQQQIVIKSLGDALGGIAGISGGAIMPDGRVGLILDVGGLVNLAQQ